MYGLPHDLDLSAFVGCTLDAVTYTENTLHLQFDKAVSVTIQSSYSYSDKAGVSIEREEVPPNESRLMQLTGQIVQHATRLGKGTLMLEFELGQRLEVFDGSEQYESYQIAIAGNEIIV